MSDYSVVCTICLCLFQSPLIDTIHRMSRFYIFGMNENSSFWCVVDVRRFSILFATKRKKNLAKVEHFHQHELVTHHWSIHIRIQYSNWTWRRLQWHNKHLFLHSFGSLFVLLCHFIFIFFSLVPSCVCVFRFVFLCWYSLAANNLFVIILWGCDTVSGMSTLVHGNIYPQLLCDISSSQRPTRWLRALHFFQFICLQLTQHKQFPCIER